MSRQLPLTIPIFHAVFDNAPYTADEPPKEYQEIEALPDLKAKLEYFNKNVCSLAHHDKWAVYFGWKEPLTIFNSKSGKHTQADFELFQEMRAKEIKRLTDELNKRKTYSEKVAYLITQPGFSIERLVIDEDIDLQPAKRPPADVAAFNEITKAEFERDYFPTRYRGLVFEKEKEAIAAQLEKANDPDYEIATYMQQIEDYAGYKTGKQRPERELGTAQLNRPAKDTLLSLLHGTYQPPNLCAEPLYDYHWENIEHGQQVFKLYQWLKAWQPGKESDDKNTSEAAELKYSALIYALYHHVMIEMGRKEPFKFNDDDKFPKGRIEETAEGLYLKGRDWWKPNTFYKRFKEIDLSIKKNFTGQYGSDYKQKLIAISGNSLDVIKHLEGYPD